MQRGRMRPGSWKATWVCAAAAVVLTMAPARAATFNAVANCGTAYGQPTFDQMITERSADAGCANDDKGYFPPGFASADAAGDDLTGLHAEAQASHAHTAQAGVEEDDTVVAAAPGLAGQPGTISLTYFVDGYSSLDASGRVQVIIGSNGDYVPRIDQVVDGPVTFGQNVTADLNATFGSGVSIGAYLGISTYAGDINFFHTFELIGIQAFDSAGNPVTATFTGEDGLDYGTLAAANAAALGGGASSVPEPSTWALMAVGFAGLGLAGARQRRRRGRTPREGAPDACAGAVR